MDNITLLRTLIQQGPQILADLERTNAQRDNTIELDLGCQRTCANDHYHGRCTCCITLPIMADGMPNAAWTLHYWYGPSHKTPDGVWPVCKPCKAKLERDINFLNTKRIAFGEFQRHRAKDNQLPLFAYTA